MSKGEDSGARQPRLRRADHYYGLRIPLEGEGREAVIFVPAPFTVAEARQVQQVCGILESAADAGGEDA